MLSLNIFLLLIIFGLGMGRPVMAAEIFEPFQSIRQLGMGGVYVFDENDGSSFLQNPAYTCFVKGLNWSLLNVAVGVGDAKQATFIQSNPITTATDLNKYYGKDFFLGLGGFSSLALPCFGMAGYFTGVASFKVHNPAYPVLKTFYVSEYGVKFGGGFPLGPNLAFGMDVSRVDRKGGPYDFGPGPISGIRSADEITTLVQSIQNQGVGYGLDLGFVGRFSELVLNPTLSISWKDVGSTQFAKTVGNEAPNRQRDNLVIGSTVGSSFLGFGFAMGLEYRHINDNDEQIGKKLHAGAELQLGFVDLRAGFYQGYYGYGAGVDLWLLQVDAALYTVEKGIYAGQTPEQRAQIGLLMELEFDPNFNLVESNGRKRRLKQRR